MALLDPLPLLDHLDLNFLDYQNLPKVHGFQHITLFGSGRSIDSPTKLTFLYCYETTSRRIYYGSRSIGNWRY